MGRVTLVPGSRKGRLTILGDTGKREVARGYRILLCKCDCGATKEIASNTVSRSTSCGCWGREKAAARNRSRATHGLSGHELYPSWRNLVSRCCNPKDSSWPRYGGRGITVCERWTGSDGISNFIADMGDRPSSDHSLDRIDNDGPYSPENCRWATGVEQSANRHQPFMLRADEADALARELATTTVPLLALLRKRLLER